MYLKKSQRFILVTINLVNEIYVRPLQPENKTAL